MLIVTDNLQMSVLSTAAVQRHSVHRLQPLDDAGVGGVTAAGGRVWLLFHHHHLCTDRRLHLRPYRHLPSSGELVAS